MTQAMARRWWEDDGCSYRLLSGVFEGGGAKGVAYSGALRAVREANCWFSGVAGASAGAITAAMVASGLGPKEITDLTPVALSKLSLRPVFRGLRKLKRTGGYVDASELREWLTQLMESQYQVLTGTPWASSNSALMAGLSGTDTVTFIGLHEASGIELNVVAADLTARQHIVFNAVNTPHCGVVEAVIASSSIPGVFENADVIIGDAIHTVVDGGVWSNFPMFIFSESYRRFAHEQWAGPLKNSLVAKVDPSGLPEGVSPENFVEILFAGVESKAPDLVVGFVLDDKPVEDGTPESIGTLQRAHFSNSHSSMLVKPAEWAAATGPQADSGHPPEQDGPRSSRLGWLLAPLKWIAFLYLRVVPQWASEHSRGGSFNPAFRGRWPEPQSRTVRWLVHWVDDIAGSFYRITFLVVAWLALAITTGLGIGELYQFIEPLRVEDPDFLSNLLVTIAEIGWFIAALTAVTVALLSLIAFLAASFGLRAVRRVGYGLVRTYVAGTGAPPWSGYATNEHVIRLPIGHCVTTLSFDMKDEQREAVQNDALVTTRDALRQVLAEPPSRGLPGEIT